MRRVRIEILDDNDNKTVKFTRDFDFQHSLNANEAYKDASDLLFLKWREDRK